MKLTLGERLLESLPVESFLHVWLSHFKRNAFQRFHALLGTPFVIFHPGPRVKVYLAARLVDLLALDVMPGFDSKPVFVVVQVSSVVWGNMISDFLSATPIQGCNGDWCSCWA